MSTLFERYLAASIKKDLQEKMVFVAGPRQVGKTTLAQGLIPNYRQGHPAYLNWDDDVHRKKIRERAWPASEKLIVFDELHKYARWSNMLKGLFDTLREIHSFLVIGSARLDYYRKGGDSLLGRYHFYRLHPLTIPELPSSLKDVDRLLRFGGFPQPFLRANERQLRRWHLSRLSQLVREDLRDLEQVREISLIEQLAEMLPDRAGGVLSIKALSEDLQIDFKTAARWISILENLYYVYRIPPFGAQKIRAVKKEQKLYMWDWSQVPAMGAKFENMVAGHLLKYCHFLEDYEGYRMELQFLRDMDKREIDFVVLRDRKPIFAVECKTGEKKLSPHIRYFESRTSIPKFYQVHLGTTHKTISPKIIILPFEAFCKTQPLV
jgi:predicted AAA+ superfamily ATPase